MIVDVVFPRVLAPIVGDALRGMIELDAETDVRTALERRWPGVTNHLFDATGVMRPHVLCFIDDASDRLEDPSASVQDGSEIRFVQAVSGG